MDEVECGHCSREGPDIQVSAPRTPQNTAVNSVSSMTSQRGSPVDSPLSRLSLEEEDVQPSPSPVPAESTMPDIRSSLPQVDHCPVCQHVPIAPRKLSPCGHVLCELCWVNLFQHDSYDAQCPMCRSSITHTEADAALEFQCRMVYSEAGYKKRFDENRELIVQVALEPAAQRPPIELLRREYDDAQLNHTTNVKDYEAAQKKIKHLRWAMTIAPIVETLCALLLVALSDGSSRWIICLLITAGWWVHKMEHYIPEQLDALRSIPYPQRRPVIDERRIEQGRTVRHHLQPMHRTRRAMPSLELAESDLEPQLTPIDGRRSLSSRNTGGATVVHGMI